MTLVVRNLLRYNENFVILLAKKLRSFRCLTILQLLMNSAVSNLNSPQLLHVIRFDKHNLKSCLLDFSIITDSIYDVMLAFSADFDHLLKINTLEVRESDYLIQNLWVIDAVRLFNA